MENIYKEDSSEKNKIILMGKDIQSFIYAGFWIRFIAFCIDILVIKLLTNTVVNPLLALTSIKAQGLFLNVFITAIYLSYFVLMTKFTNGQTLGKMIFNLRVVCFKEEKLSWYTVLIRELCGRYIQKIILLLYLIAGFNEKKQHFADYLCDTTVIKNQFLYLYEKERSAL